MDLYSYVWFFALFVYVYVIVSIPFKIKKYGKSEKTMQKGFWFRMVMIFIFSLALLLLCKLFKFGQIQNLALEGCAALGAYIASKEIWEQEDSEE